MLTQYVATLTGYDAMAARMITQTIRIYARTEAEARMVAAKQASWFTRHQHSQTRFSVSSLVAKV